jgi:hypothetical protein
MIKFFQNLALFCVKNANFFANFLRKYLKNLYIGPWSHCRWKKGEDPIKKKMAGEAQNGRGQNSIKNRCYMYTRQGDQIRRIFVPWAMVYLLWAVF